MMANAPASLGAHLGCRLGALRRCVSAPRLAGGDQRPQRPLALRGRCRLTQPAPHRAPPPRSLANHGAGTASAAVAAWGFRGGRANASVRSVRSSVRSEPSLNAPNARFANLLQDKVERSSNAPNATVLTPTANARTSPLNRGRAFSVQGRALRILLILLPHRAGAPAAGRDDRPRARGIRAGAVSLCASRLG
jgi:hypothetical protein